MSLLVQIGQLLVTVLPSAGAEHLQHAYLCKLAVCLLTIDIPHA